MHLLAGDRRQLRSYRGDGDSDGGFDGDRRRLTGVSRRRLIDDDSGIGNLDIGDDEFDRFDVHPRVRRRVRRVARRSHPRTRRIRRRIRRNVDLHSVDPKDVKDEKAKAEPSGGYFGGSGRRRFGGHGRRRFGGHGRRRFRFGDGDGGGFGDGFFGRGD